MPIASERTLRYSRRHTTNDPSGMAVGAYRAAIDPSRNLNCPYAAVAARASAAIAGASSLRGGRKRPMDRSVPHAKLPPSMARSRIAVALVGVLLLAAVGEAQFRGRGPGIRVASS